MHHLQARAWSVQLDIIVLDLVQQFHALLELGIPPQTLRPAAHVYRALLERIVTQVLQPVSQLAIFAQLGLSIIFPVLLHSPIVPLVQLGIIAQG